VCSFEYRYDELISDKECCMLKVAVIGLGWWGRIIVDVLANNPKLQVVRVVDIGAAGQAFAQERSLPFSLAIRGRFVGSAGARRGAVYASHPAHRSNRGRSTGGQYTFSVKNPCP